MHCHKTLNKDLKTDSKLSYNRDNLGLKIAADIAQKKAGMQNHSPDKPPDSRKSATWRFMQKAM